MSGFAQTVTRIKGLSDRRRLPRLGKIRLGFKLKKGTVEYPAELPFFLLPPEVARIYGGKVTLERAKELGVTRQDVLNFVSDNLNRLAEEIEIMLPINEIDSVFPNAYKWYGGQKGVKCMGNGETALRFDEESKAMIEIECPCDKLKSETNPKGECTQRGHLLCLIPKVNMGGIYQIDIGSVNSIIDVNSGIDYVQALVGRFALVPLILRRIPTQTHHDGKKQVHYTLQLIMNVPIDQLEGLRKDTGRILQHSTYALPAPEDINPAMDSTSDIVIEAEAIADETPESSPTFEQLIATCQTIEALAFAWDDILKSEGLKGNSKAVNERRKSLNVLMKKKKDEITKGCTQNPKTCDKSKFDDKNNVFCGETEKCEY